MSTGAVLLGIQDDLKSLDKNIMFESMRKYNDAVFSYPYMSDSTWIGTWKPTFEDESLEGEEREKSIRYENFGSYVFKLLQAIYVTYKGNIDEIEIVFPFKPLANLHKVWWNKMKGKDWYFYDADFEKWMNDTYPSE